MIQALIVAGMFGMFFLGALYLQRVLGYDALEIGLAFLPVAIVMGTLSLRFSERLIMRFGAARRCSSGPGADRRGPGPVRARAGRRQLRGRRAAADAPARHRGRPLLPGADDAGDVGRDAAATPGSPRAWSTPRCRSAARSGLAVLATLSTTRTDNLLGKRRTRTAAALTSGYHLAFWIGAGLVTAAIAVTTLVLRSAPALAEAEAFEGPEGVPEVEGEPSLWEAA